MSEYDERKVLTVQCPKCEALPGERCRTKTRNASACGPATRPSAYLHNGRKALVYPRFGKSSSGGVKPGQGGFLNVFSAAYSAGISVNEHHVIIVARNLIDAKERLRLALGERYGHQAAADIAQESRITEVDVTGEKRVTFLDGTP